MNTYENTIEKEKVNKCRKFTYILAKEIFKRGEKSPLLKISAKILDIFLQKTTKAFDICNLHSSKHQQHIQLYLHHSFP